MSELMHYGVLGMKWGVRKDGMPQGYQGPDRKFYNVKRIGNYDEYHINAKGAKANKKAKADYNRYKSAVAANVRLAHPELTEKIKRYKELQNADSTFAKTELDKWVDKKDYKGLSWEKFKDARYDRWMATPQGKEQFKLEKDIRALITEAANAAPQSRKSYTVYRTYRNVHIDNANPAFTETVNYGNQVVHELMTEIEYGVRVR